MDKQASRHILYWKIWVAIQIFGSFVFFELMDWRVELWLVYAVGALTTLLLRFPDDCVKERIALFVTEHDILKDEIAKARLEIARLQRLEFESVMDKLGFTETTPEPVPGKQRVMYAGKYANLTDAEITVFGTEHEKIFPGSGEVLLYL